MSKKFKLLLGLLADRGIGRDLDLALASAATAYLLYSNSIAVDLASMKVDVCVF